MRKSQYGFTVVEVLLIVLVLSVLGFAGYYVSTQNKKNDDSKAPAATTTTSQTTTKSEDKKVSTPPEGFKEYIKEPLAFYYPSMWNIRDESGSKYIASDTTWDLHITLRTNDEPDDPSSQVEFIVKPTTYTNEELLASYSMASHYSDVKAVEANGIKGTYGEVSFEGTSKFVDYVYNGKEYKFSSYVLSKDKLLELTSTLRIK